MRVNLTQMLRHREPQVTITPVLLNLKFRESCPQSDTRVVSITRCGCAAVASSIRSVAKWSVCGRGLVDVWSHEVAVWSAYRTRVDGAEYVGRQSALLGSRSPIRRSSHNADASGTAP